MDTVLLKEYEDAMLKKRDAEATIERIKNKVIEQIRLHGVSENGGARHRAISEYGSFTLSKYKKYIFSDNVRVSTQQLRELKNKEIEEGIATIDECEMLMFKQN
jgi:hypothetical protein